MLQDWLEKLKHEDLNKQTSEIIAEIEAIRKQLILDTGNNTNDLDAPCIANKSIVPNDVMMNMSYSGNTNSLYFCKCI